MIVYVVTFLISILFLWGIFFTFGNLPRVKYSLLYIVPVFPAIIAGIRNMNIGTDIKNYGYSNFILANQYSSFNDYYNAIKQGSDTEIGYAFLNFIVSRFTDNISIFFFVLSYITILLVILSLDKIHKIYGINIVISFVLYLLIFFPISLNLMRQSLAMSIVFFATTELLGSLEKNKIYSYFKFIFIILIAFLFHRTAIIFLILMPLLFMKKTNRKYSLNVLLVIFLSILLIVANSSLANSLISSNIFSKYSLYTNNSDIYLKNGGIKSFLGILLNIIPTLLFVFGYFKNNVRSRKYIILSGIAILEIVFQFTSMWSTLLPRLGLYFAMFKIIYLDMDTILFSENNTRTYKILLVIYAIIFFIINAKLGYNEIYPYQSDILENIL